MIIFLISILKIFGNIHGHTGYSDGCGTPYEAFEFAKNHNLKIYGLTEHSHLLTQNKWNDIIYCKNLFKDENFLPIIGQEVGKLNYYGHINVYEENLNEIIPEKCFYNLDSIYEYIKNKNLIGIFNHPYEFHFRDFENSEKYKDYICGIEIINKDSVYEKRVIEAIKKGWELCFIASQDNHQCLWGIEKNKRERIPLTCFLVDSLSEKEIFKALRKRKTYAFELFPEDDTIYADFRIDGFSSGERIFKNINFINVKIDASAKIPFVKIFIYIDERIDSIFTYSEKIEIEKEYYLERGKHFLFAKLVQSDFDRVYLSPVFIEIKDERIIYPEIIKGEINGNFKIIGKNGRFLKKIKGSEILFLRKGEKVQKIIYFK